MTDNRTEAAIGGDYEAFLASKQVHAPAVLPTRLRNPFGHSEVNSWGASA